jgi:hypothetical protein
VPTQKANLSCEIGGLVLAFWPFSDWQFFWHSKSEILAAMLLGFFLL